MPLVHYNLSVNDPRKLQQQLAAGEYLDDLQALQGGQYLHFAILQSYLLCEHPVSRALWSACLDELLKLKAPLEYGSSCAAAAFLDGFRWANDGMSPLDVAQKYLDAGHIAVDRPLRGDLPHQQHTKQTFCGKLPLAVAIGLDTPTAVRFLLANGASLNIGPQFVGDPDRGALEFAQEMSAHACAAEIIRYLMEQRLKPAAPAGPAIHEARARNFPRASM